ncbi:hypothetical protein GEMRC1_007917 [Eukaryota sp. GEM-RC1]
MAYINSLSSASKPTSFHHIVNCPKFIHIRSVLHTSIRDHRLFLFESNGCHGKIEPLLSAFSDCFIRDKNRGDLIGPWLNCKEVGVEFATVDPCNAAASSKILDDQFSHLHNAEDKKCLRYCDYISNLNSQRHNALVFQPFGLSISGNLGSAAQTFLSSFHQLCCKFGKKFSISFWRDRLVFSIFRSMFQYFDGMLKKLFGVQDHVME